MTTHFGTDGIRQPADAFTDQFLGAIAVGLANYATASTATDLSTSTDLSTAANTEANPTQIAAEPPTDFRVFLAGDTRESSEWIISSLANAFESLGVDYAIADVLPTPGINYCFYQMGYDFAIDVTASHNPYTDNGIKIFERGPHSGIKLSPAGREIIEATLAKMPPLPTVAPSLREDLHQDAVNLYKEHLLSYLGEDTNFSGLNLIIDCANGATSVIGDSLFKTLGANATLIHADPAYGTGINRDCGSTHPESLIDMVVKNHYDFGVAFDGDGDRCILVDHTGALIDGDQILAIIAHHLNLDAIAVTVMANQGLLSWAKDNNINLEITAVGDSNVAEAMALHHIQLGGEQSGHIILPGEPTGDGMLTALVITKIIAETGKSLHELASIITKYPQVIVNLPATPEQKERLKTSPEAKQLLLDYNQKLAAVSGRLLVRPSGTEPLVRITMWGNDEPTITALADELKTKLEEIL